MVYGNTDFEILIGGGDNVTALVSHVYTYLHFILQGYVSWVEHISFLNNRKYN